MVVNKDIQFFLDWLCSLDEEEAEEAMDKIDKELEKIKNEDSIKKI